MTTSARGTRWRRPELWRPRHVARSETGHNVHRLNRPGGRRLLWGQPASSVRLLTFLFWLLFSLTNGVVWALGGWLLSVRLHRLDHLSLKQNKKETRRRHLT